MKILITSNEHQHYDRVGEIVGRFGERWKVRIPDRSGSVVTFVSEGEFKPTRDEALENVDPAGTLSEDGRYQADGLGCVERISSVERDWLDPSAHNPRGY